MKYFFIVFYFFAVGLGVAADEEEKDHKNRYPQLSKVETKEPFYYIKDGKKVTLPPPQQDPETEDGFVIIEIEEGKDARDQANKNLPATPTTQYPYNEAEFIEDLTNDVREKIEKNLHEYSQSVKSAYEDYVIPGVVFVTGKVTKRVIQYTLEKKKWLDMGKDVANNLLNWIDRKWRS